MYKKRLKSLNNKYQQYIGQVFGDWKIEAIKRREQHPRWLFLVKCKCGIKTYRPVAKILHGESTRCSDCRLKDPYRTKEKSVDK